MTLCCLVQILVLRDGCSQKGSQGNQALLFEPLFLTPYNDSIPIQFPFPPIIHPRNLAGTGY
jgi:hypothetical protein